MNHATVLSPAQAQAFDKLLDHARRDSVTVLASGAGRGRTTVLRAASARLGGIFLDARAQIDALVDQNPHAIEETIYRLFYEASMPTSSWWSTIFSCWHRWCWDATGCTCERDC